MTNRQVAEILFNVATLLDMAHDNIYRVRAYRRAARHILALREEATAIVARGDELPLPGVGERIRGRLVALLAEGSLNIYEELLEDLPRSMRALMAIDGIGPWTALRLYQDLEIGSPEELVSAASDGRIHQLYGFGARREANLAAAARVALTGSPAPYAAAPVLTGPAAPLLPTQLALVDAAA